MIAQQMHFGISRLSFADSLVFLQWEKKCLDCNFDTVYPVQMTCQQDTIEIQHRKFYQLHMRHIVSHPVFDTCVEDIAYKR